MLTEAQKFQLQMCAQDIGGALRRALLEADAAGVRLSLADSGSSHMAAVELDAVAHGAAVGDLFNFDAACASARRIVSGIAGEITRLGLTLAAQLGAELVAQTASMRLPRALREAIKAEQPVVGVRCASCGTLCAPDELDGWGCIANPNCMY